MAGPSSSVKRRPPPEPRAVRPNPKDEAEIRAGIEEAERGGGVLLTTEQTEAYLRWLETGEGPCPVDFG